MASTTSTDPARRAGTPPRVRVVVLNFNGGEFVLRCLRALLDLEWPRAALEIVVVDNASTDGSLEQIRVELPDVRIISSGANHGFPANNLGLDDRRDVDYLALVNNDAFVEPGWLAPLVEALEADTGLGAASSKMVFAPAFVDLDVETPTFKPSGGDSRDLGVMIRGVRVDDEDAWRDAQFADGCWGVEHSPSGPFEWTAGRALIRVPVAPGGAVPGRVEVRLEAESEKKVELRCGNFTATVTVGAEPAWFPIEVEGVPYDVINNVGSVIYEGGYGGDRGYLEADRGQYDEPAEVFAFCGGSVLFRRAFLDDVGLLDERFFLYYEDTDLAWRGQGRGWRYRYVPESQIRHIHAASSGEGSAVFQHFVERNRLLMLLKNAPKKMVIEAVVRFLLATASYGRRDVVSPLLRRRRPNLTQVRRRLGSFAGFVRLIPAMVVARHRIRGSKTVDDAELARWFVAK